MNTVSRSLIHDIPRRFGRVIVNDEFDLVGGRLNHRFDGTGKGLSPIVGMGTMPMRGPQPWFPQAYSPITQ
jgi:S-adenosylmethionine synthetase